MPTVNHLALTPHEESLAHYVRRIRGLRGLSASELARRARVHVTSVLRLEAGKVSGRRMRLEVRKRLSVALQIPAEYLRAASRGESLEARPTNAVCPACWVPGTTPDVRWSLSDAKFCLLCGERLRDSCPGCAEPILLTGRFCPSCGKPYRSLSRLAQPEEFEPA
jgi:transcriptional regulator with XRE-family HTH domain